MKKKILGIAALVFLTGLTFILLQGAGAVELKRGKAPALSGEGATDVITATGPDFTIYYVKKGGIRIQTKFMEEFAKSPVGKFVGDGLQAGLSMEDIVTKGVAAGYSPCELVKGFVVHGAKLAEVIKVFLAKNLLPPCGLLRCALEAVRGVKMVEVEAGQYSIVTPGRCAIEGSMTEDDWKRLQILMEEGLISAEELPHWPPDKEQAVAAGCCETVELAQVFIAAGADLEDLRACMNAIGCGYASTLPAAPPVSRPGPPSPSS